MNATNEDEVRDTIKNILGSDDGIVWVNEKIRRNTGADDSSKPIFMAELKPEAKQILLERKAEFFKTNQNIKIGINEALTAQQLRNRTKRTLPDVSQPELPTFEFPAFRGFRGDRGGNARFGRGWRRWRSSPWCLRNGKSRQPRKVLRIQ